MFYSIADIQLLLLLSKTIESQQRARLFVRISITERFKKYYEKKLIGGYMVLCSGLDLLRVERWMWTSTSQFKKNLLILPSSFWSIFALPIFACSTFDAAFTVPPIPNPVPDPNPGPCPWPGLFLPFLSIDSVSDEVDARLFAILISWCSYLRWI